MRSFGKSKKPVKAEQSDGDDSVIFAENSDDETSKKPITKYESEDEEEDEEDEEDSESEEEEAHHIGWQIMYIQVSLSLSMMIKTYKIKQIK